MDERPFDLIIFDCDGTLVDTEYLNLLAICDTLADEGFTKYTIEYGYKHFLGYKFSDTINNIAEETGHVFPKDIGARYIRRVQDLAPQHFKRIEGALRLVEQVAATPAKLCVASNGERGNVITSLEMAELKPFFPDNNIFVGADVKTPKPAPDLFLHAARQMDAAPERTLVLEDSDVGVSAGVAAGMTVWGFSGAHAEETYGQRLLNCGAHQCFSSLIHIAEALKKPKELLSVRQV